MTPPTVRAQVSTADPYDTPSWDDLPDVKSVSIVQGRTAAFDETAQPQQFTVELDNADRGLDPANSAATLYGVTTPQRRVRVLVDHADLDAETDLAHGFAKGWPYSTRLLDSTTSVDTRDWLSVMADRPLPSSPYAVEVLADSPYAWYRMDETAGDRMIDSSGNERHGDWEGNALENSTDSLISDPGHAVEFDVTDDSARASIGLAPFAAWEFWIQTTEGPDELGTNVFIVHHYCTASGYAQHVVVSNNGVFLNDNVDGLYSPSSIYKMTDGRPHHVAWIHASKTFIIDGNELAADGPAVSTSDNVGRDQLAIGRTLSGVRYAPDVRAPVILEEVAYYDVAPTVERFQAHYTAATTAWDLDPTGTRLGRILDAAGQLPADRDIDDGMRVLGPASMGNTASAELQRVARTEQGVLYQKPNGALRFRAGGSRESETLRTGTATYVGSSDDYTPVAQSTVASASNGVNTSTFAGAGVLHVADVHAFAPTGTLFYVVTGGTPAVVTYTGKSSTGSDPRFTGCTTVSGGGVLSTGAVVADSIPYDEGRQYAVSVPGLPDVSANVAVRNPTVTSTGWVVVLSQDYGDNWWTGGGTSGEKETALAAQLADRGLGVLSVKWDPGWLIAPFGAHTGIRQLAARPAALIRQLYADIVLPDVDNLIITGQSAGSSQAAYSMMCYGLKDIVKRVVLTAGPPHARIDRLAGATGTDYDAPGPALQILDASEGEYDPNTNAGDTLGPAQNRVEDGWWRREWRLQSAGQNPDDDLDWTGVTVGGLFGEDDDTGAASAMHDYFELLRTAGQDAPRAVGPDDHPISLDRITRLWPLIHDESVPLCVSPRINNSATTDTLTVDVKANDLVAGRDMTLLGCRMVAIHLAETVHGNMSHDGVAWSEIDTFTVGGVTVIVYQRLGFGLSGDDSITFTTTTSVHQEAVVCVGWVPGSGTPTLDLTYSQSDAGAGDAGTGDITIGPTGSPASDDEFAIVLTAVGTASGGWKDWTPAMADYGFARDFAGDRMIVGTVGIHDGNPITTVMGWTNLRNAESRIYTWRDV